MVILKKHTAIPNDFLTASQKVFIGNSSAHIHEFFEIEYIISGSGICIIDGCEYPMSEGSLFLLSPVNTHAIRASNAELINVMFKCEYSEEFLTLPTLHSSSAPHFKLNEDDSKLIRSLLTELVKVYEDDIKYARLLLQCVLQKLTYYIKSKSNEAFLPYISHALLYITEGFRRGITLDSTAKQLGLSATYFSELFSKELGISFKHYLDDIRFSHAMDLLAFTSLPVCDIHQLAGFSDYANFSRRFKKLYGMTPTEYRYKHKTNAPS